MKTLSQFDLECYALAAGIFACGQDGEEPRIKDMIKEAVDKRYTFTIGGQDEIPENEFICTVSLRSGGGVSREIRDRLINYKEAIDRESRVHKAAKVLSDFIEENFFAYVPTGTSPLQGITALIQSAREGKPCVDGDCSGRAKPGISLSLTFVAGIPAYPAVMVTPYDETLILKNAVDDFRVEDIITYLHVVSGSTVSGVARCSARMKAYKNAIVWRRISDCVELGKTIFVARNKGLDPVAEFVKKLVDLKMYGAILFKGTVSSYRTEGIMGFDYGDWIIEGEEQFRGHTYRVWSKNEHQLGWLDGIPHFTCPDILAVVDTRDCRSLSYHAHTNAYNGRAVTVLGIENDKKWKTKKALEVWNPRYFDFEIDYIPFGKNG